MPAPGPRDVCDDLYLIACGRVLTLVMKLVHAHGVAMRVDIDPSRITPQALLDIHHIQIICGRAKRIMAVDHETFMDGEFFRTLVLHQAETIIEELAREDRRLVPKSIRGKPPALA
jgi:hypothetical protein